MHGNADTFLNQLNILETMMGTFYLFIYSFVYLFIFIYLFICLYIYVFIYLSLGEGVSE